MTPARRSPRSADKAAPLPSNGAPLAPRASAPLAEYDRKRDFDKTPEPAGAVPPAAGGPLTFVVQKHAARRLHYDLRLEWDGVMPSWAVPNGPSVRIADKHLAVHVEDHPLDYATFEGIIPRGSYGAGQVIVWDNGTYSPDEGGYSFGDRAEAEARMRAGLEAGKLSITFRGRKLKGSWTLVRTNRVEAGKTQWLLIKHRGATADPERDLTAEDRSVLTGLTLDDLKAGRLPDRDARRTFVAQPADLPGARLAQLPAPLEPMHAEDAKQPFSDPRWLFEPKLDGIRAIVTLRDRNVDMRSRRGLDLTRQYPALARDLARQPAHTLVLDGEIVALDERGAPSFELLQQRMNLGGEAGISRADVAQPVLLYAFDLLYVDGVDLRAVPLVDRLETLARVLLPTESVRLVEHFDEGEAAYHAAVAHGFEGLVAKRRDSPYEAGRRSRHWLKIKSRLSDDFVVGGYTGGEGARASTFGALLLGWYDDEGALRFAGQAGSGFDDRTLAAVRKQLDALTTANVPFAERPPRGLGGPHTYVRPELVVEVEFANWTRDGRLRAPVFKRLRPDKAPREVVRTSVEVASDLAAAQQAETAGAATSLAGQVESVLAQVAGARKALTLEVEGQRIRLANLDKEMWPAADGQPPVTKRDLLEYYARVAPWLLPHLRDRPLTMTRYPNGIAQPFFYQKHYDDAPEFVERIRSHSETAAGDQTYLLCNNLATLLWLGQMADIALHSSLARVGPEPDGHHLSRDFTGSREQLEGSLLNHPDFILFDLDPYIYAGTEGAGEEPELNRKAYAKVREVALWFKELLESASLSAFVKTSGATGLHVYVPVVRQYDYAAIRSVCATFASFLIDKHPREVTSEWAVPKRAGKVFLDCNQNARFKSLAVAYSPRAKPGAPVSTPLRWEELERYYPTDFTIRTLPERLAQRGDPWANILEAKHDLRALLET